MTDERGRAVVELADPVTRSKLPYMGSGLGWAGCWGILQTQCGSVVIPGPPQQTPGGLEACVQGGGVPSRWRAAAYCRPRTQAWDQTDLNWNPGSLLCDYLRVPNLSESPLPLPISMTRQWLPLPFLPCKPDSMLLVPRIKGTVALLINLDCYWEWLQNNIRVWDSHSLSQVMLLTLPV
jgi:hypothetical protein